MGWLVSWRGSVEEVVWVGWGGGVGWLVGWLTWVGW